MAFPLCVIPAKAGVRSVKLGSAFAGTTKPKKEFPSKLDCQIYLTNKTRAE
jgi:hypothetical protein